MYKMKLYVTNDLKLNISFVPVKKNIEIQTLCRGKYLPRKRVTQGKKKKKTVQKAIFHSFYSNIPCHKLIQTKRKNNKGK